MITYEWVAEEVDENEDIIDPQFGDTLKQVITYIAPGDNVSYALVRNEGNDDDGLLDRQYAYIKNGKLPAAFDDSSRIPVKYLMEVTKAGV